MIIRETRTKPQHCFTFLPAAGLFDANSAPQEAAFDRAVTAVNDDRSILTKAPSMNNMVIGRDIPHLTIEVF